MLTIQTDSVKRSLTHLSQRWQLFANSRSRAF